MINKFSKWVKWSDRNELHRMEYPGVYAISLSKQNISETPFSWRQEIVYVGMTNAKGGLKSRLQRFDYTIKGGDGHGGAKRVRFKHPRYDKLLLQLYVSVCPTECNVTSNDPVDLRMMGKVAKREYECLADFVDAFDQLPEFNDKEKSPKK